MGCPICGARADMTPKNPYRPFCSERCRLIDLGKWAGGDYSVAGKAAPDTEHPDDFTKKRPTK